MQTTCKNMEKKKKVFKTFNQLYEIKKTHCFIGLKILKNSQNTTVFTQQA